MLILLTYLINQIDNHAIFETFYCYVILEFFKGFSDYLTFNLIISINKHINMCVTVILIDNNDCLKRVTLLFSK